MESQQVVVKADQGVNHKPVFDIGGGPSACLYRVLTAFSQSNIRD